MKRKEILRFIRSLSNLLLILCIGGVLAFFAMSFIYEKSGWYPSNFTRQVLQSFIGGVFAIIMIAIGAFIFRKRIKKRIDEAGGIFSRIIEAIEKIATGDFNIHIDSKQPDERFAELVKSMNYMAAELGKMEEMKQEFISNVSHEIGSPLTSIRGFATALKQNDLDEAERNRYLTIIEMESVRLSKLSSNLMRLTLLDAENRTFEPKMYRLDKQLRNSILSCEPQWTKKNITIEAIFDPVTITADEQLLSQVWQNLIYNSIKFTPENGEITLTLSMKEEQIHFTITDTGIGIPKEHIAYIFERFFKVDKSRIRSMGGSGLGLSIVKKIIDIHNGTIEVESIEGKGSTFIVLLPLKPSVVG